MEISEEINLADNLEESEPKDSSSSVKRASQVLRYIGAILLLGSAVAFSLQGWAQWGSVLRHFAFLGFATTLTGLGMLCGVTFKEDKGARTFIGVAVAIVPALFAQLGAMLYAYFYSVQNGFPDFLRYSSPSALMLAGVFILSVLVSISVSYAGFRVFLGLHAKTLTTVFILSNALILIPLRQEGIVALLVAIQLISIAAINWRKIKGSHESRTWEGYAARGILLLPSLLMLFRAAFLYTFGGYCIALCFTLFGLLMLHKAVSARESSNAPIFRVASVTSLACAWMYVVEGFYHSVGYSTKIVGTQTGFREALIEFWPLIEYLPVAGIFALCSFAFIGKGRGYRSFAGLIAVYSSINFMMIQTGVLGSFVCLLLGGLMLFAATVVQEKGLLATGLFSFLLGIISQCHIAISIYSVSPWASLALSGIVVVGSAVYLERNGNLVCKRLRDVRAVVSAWQ